MTQRNKQARQTFHCFVLNSHFFQPSECKYVTFCLFVCLSDFYSLRFRYFGLEIFFPNSCSIEGKSSCATHSTIFAEKNQKLFFATLPTAKIKIHEK